MTKRNFFILAVFLAAIFFFKQVYALEPMADSMMKSKGKAQMMEQMKGKMDTIKHHKAVNTKLKKQAEEKIGELEKLLVRLDQSNIANKEKIQCHIERKIKVYKNRMKQIEKVEMHMNDCVNMANKHMAENKPEECIKMLDMAISDLEKEHHMLVQLNKSLDEFIKFLKSLENK